MTKIVVTVLVLLGVLTGCGEDINPTLGKWWGKITEEQRMGLTLPKGEANGLVMIEFTNFRATLNGKSLPVEHKKNEQFYYINETGTNRTMAARFTDPDTMELGIPHRFKAEIVFLSMSRVPAAP
jgi:hypothetical protein